MKMRYSHFYKIENTAKYMNSASFYHLAMLKKADGSPLYLMFTDNEVAIASSRAGKNVEDIPKTALAPVDCPCKLKLFMSFLSGGVLVASIFVIFGVL